MQQWIIHLADPITIIAISNENGAILVGLLAAIAFAFFIQWSLVKQENEDLRDEMTRRSEKEEYVEYYVEDDDVDDEVEQDGQDISNDDHV